MRNTLKAFYMTYTKITYSLGIVGLTPFIIGVALSLHQYEIYGVSGVAIFTTYSLAILCFLAGSLWGQVLKIPFSSNNQKILIATNILVVIGWAASLTSAKFLVAGIIVLGLTFAGIAFLEVKLFKHSAVLQDGAYARLRFILTNLVLAAHAAMVIIHV